MIKENKITKYLTFVFKGTSDSGKTGRYVVVSALTGTILGWIEFHAPWRKYWFCPLNGTAYDASCLADITNFLVELTAERKS